MNSNSLDLSKTITSPFVAYAMGFIWGDGYLFKHPRWKTRGVAIESKESDFGHIVASMSSICDNWKILKRIRYGKLYCRIYKTDHEMFDWLEKLGFRKKNLSHRKVLEAIQPSLRRFFVLGLFDADGHIHDKDGKNACVCIAGPKNQQWGAIISILKEEEILTNVVRRIDNRGNGTSYLYLRDVGQIYKFYEWMYGNAPETLYLDRKRVPFERVTNFLKSKYGSTDYGRQYDYRTFQFSKFRVLRRITFQGRCSKWKCIYGDGSIKIHSSRYLSSLKSKEIKSRVT